MMGDISFEVGVDATQAEEVLTRALKCVRLIETGLPLVVDGTVLSSRTEIGD